METGFSNPRREGTYKMINLNRNQDSIRASYCLIWPYRSIRLP